LITAYLSLGSNLGDRYANLHEAVQRIERGGIHVTRLSSIYETEPQDLPDQPWFLNQIAEVETDLAPAALLTAMQKIEHEMGRERAVPKGPRTIDIDMLLYGEEVIQTPALQIPHPRMTTRRFVLEPLAELAPELRHPVTHRIIREHLPATREQKIR